MSSLDIREEPLDGVQGAVLVHLDGVLDQPTLNDFLGKLEATRSAGNVTVLLNMEGISYANSTALGALVTQADAFRDAGGELVLYSPQPKVELVIDMLGLGALFKVFGSVDEARAYVATGTGGLAPAAEPAAVHPQVAPAPAPVAGAPRPAPAPAPAPSGTTGGLGLTTFPVRAECIGCGIALEFAQAGHYRCPRCSTVYSVADGGRVAGSKARKGLPIEVTLTCNPQSLKALQQLVGALPVWEGYSDMERMRLEGAIGEICGVIHAQAYGGDENATFHALVLSRAGEIALRVADHGRPLDSAAFPITADYMTEFEHRPHPTRGNLLKMCKRAQ